MTPNRLVATILISIDIACLIMFAISYILDIRILKILFSGCMALLGCGILGLAIVILYKRR